MSSLRNLYILLDSTTDAKQMHEDYQLCPTLTPEDNIEVDKELCRLCRGTGAFLLQALGPPSDEDEDL